MKFVVTEENNMNDNKNKTNAPIKLPVRYCPEIMSVLDAGDRESIAVLDHLPDDEAQAYGNRIVAALNEADALRAEVEGYRDLLENTSKLNLDSGEKIYRGLQGYEDDTSQSETLGAAGYIFSDIAKAYAAIKPNAAAGEEGTDAV